MGGLECLCKTFKKKLDKSEEPESASCNCGWEIETGYAIAVGLAILEAKRLFLLALGVFVEWRVLYFAGGLVPLVITVTAASLGLPVALATVFLIHKRRQQPCFRHLKKLLKCLTFAIVICVALNVSVIVSFGVYLNTTPEAVAQVFNTSMKFYAEKNWQKVTVDELQFTLQCCGHTKYSDWMRFDWQKVDYASREEMSNQERISDEEFRPLAVPYSCCSIRSMTPCFHMDLSMNTGSSINEAGCAEVLSRIVFRSSAVAYCVSTFLILTQILLTLLVAKIIRTSNPASCSICDCTQKSPSASPLLESSTSCASSTTGYTSGSERNSSRTKKRGGRLSTISSRSTGGCSSTSPSPPPSSNSKRNSLPRNSSAKTRCSGGGGAARIKPSLHTEHRVPKKRCCQKRGVRPN